MFGRSGAIPQPSSDEQCSFFKNTLIICSRDSDVITVIQHNDYQVYDENEDTDHVITFDDVLDFCLRVAAAGIATDKGLKTFLKIALHGEGDSIKIKPS